MIPLHDALRLGHIEAALVLMDKMDAVGAESWNGLSYIQLLEFAAQGGCSQLVGRLLQTGDPESRHSPTDSPAHGLCAGRPMCCMLASSAAQRSVLRL